MASLEKQRAAADKLEDIASEMKDLVIQLRYGTPDAYAKVYDLHRRLGRVVATLGNRYG